VAELDLPGSRPNTLDTGTLDTGLGLKPEPELEPDAAALLSHIEPYPLLREEILTKSGFTPSRLIELLLLLELDGLIEMLPGDKVRKVSGADGE